MPGLLATKTHTPPLPQKHVERDRLVKRLNDGLDQGRRVTLVSAPAGFGKTTCICAWLQQIRPVPAAWLSLDGSDDDLGRFVTGLVAALQKVDPTLCAETAQAIGADQLPPAEALCAVLIDDLASYPGRLILVLDDFHLLQENAVFQVMARLISSLPPSLHLVLLTREDPALPLARLRAHNQLTEIRAADLRFSGSEAGQFLTDAMGLRLSGADVDRLEDRTEGWIVGLQLAGLSMRERDDPAGFIAALSGSQRHILSYLTEEVLSRQPEDVQDFLLQTSILGGLSGELCAAVTQRADCAELLERLYAANLFLVPLDDEQHWYRYHHLFADLLARKLKQTAPESTIIELHRRASAWLAGNGFVDEAIRHALEGQDLASAAALIEQVARPMIYAGRVAPLRKWLAALPETAFEAYLHLKIYRVWIDLLQGRLDLSEFAMQETDRKLAELPPSPENDRLRLELMVILGRFIALSGSTARGARYAEEALRLLPEDDLASRARAYSTLSIVYGMEGYWEKTETAFRECTRLALASGYYTLAAHTMMLRGMWLIHYGKLREAARAFQAILDIEPQAGQKVFYPAGQGLIGLATVDLEQGHLERAEDRLNRGLELCSQGGLDGLINGFILKSRLCQARGDLAGAGVEIHRLEQAFPRADYAFTLTTRQVQIHLALGDVEGATRWAAPLLKTLDSPAGAESCPLLLLEVVQASAARVLIAGREIDRALGVLAELEATAGPAGRNGRLIEAGMLRALALQKQDLDSARSAALESFIKALELAEPEGYLQSFVEEGPGIVPLLTEVERLPSVPVRMRGYARRILDAFQASHPGAALADAGEPLPAETGLVEALTRRELEVLGLIAAGCSNQEIATRLVITLSAVKKHTGNIFGKLGVSSRTQALARAHELGLLP